MKLATSKTEVSFSTQRRKALALGCAIVVTLAAVGSASAQPLTYTIVSNRFVPWSQTVTLPEFPPDSKLLGHLQIIANGDPWDRTGRVWVQTPAGRVDLFPFITGFGGTYWNDSVDVSALRTLLKGSVQFGGTVENVNWKMTLTIEEIPGGNTYKKAIWAAKVIDSGTVWRDFEGDAGPASYTVTLPNYPAQMFGKVYLSFFASGHGGSSGTGCCEFHSGRFQLWADGTWITTLTPWRNATDQFRSRNPTSGRSDGNGDGDTTDPYPTDYWSSDFGRSGWLPGDYVRPYIWDVTSALGTLSGTHTISFDYLDDIGTASGGYWILSSYVSATLSAAAPLATAIKLEASDNPSGSGNSVTFTATVQYDGTNAGGATGTISFKDGTNILGTGLVSNSVAAVATSALAPGTHTITAEYGGMTNFYQASTSAPLAQVVQPLPNLTWSVSSGQLTLGWPGSLGWILQAQTNTLDVGVGANWTDLPGSEGVTTTNLPLNAAPAAFYRLRHP